MITLATYLDSIDRARGRRSDQDISRAAGLTSNAMARMRSGKVPSLERAARVADVVGLELFIRRKGETISPWALRLAVELLLRPASERSGALPVTEADLTKRADFLAARLILAYGPFAELFDPSACDDPEEQYRVTQLFNRHVRDVESKDVARVSAVLDSLAAPVADADADADPAGSETDEGGDNDASTP